MDDELQTLDDILSVQRVAALATLHSGEPAVSMVPFAVSAAGELIVHVSRLATHTADMIDHPRVSLLAMAIDADGEMPQALPRVTITGDARRLSTPSDELDAARDAYLGTFPDAAPMTELGDFAFFAIRPISARVIGGFARAATIRGDDLIEALRRIAAP